MCSCASNCSNRSELQIVFQIRMETFSAIVPQGICFNLIIHSTLFLLPSQFWQCSRTWKCTTTCAVADWHVRALTLLSTCPKTLCLFQALFLLVTWMSWSTPSHTILPYMKNPSMTEKCLHYVGDDTLIHSDNFLSHARGAKTWAWYIKCPLSDIIV